MQDVSVPEGWFWAKLNEPSVGLRRIGYYYRDPTAGYSFHMLGELDATRESLEAAHKGSFRGEGTFRLSGHETLRVHDGFTSAEDLKTLNAEFAAARSAMVLQMSAQEREALGLPEVPPWALNYLNPPAPAAPKPEWKPSPRDPNAEARPRRLRWYPGHYVAGAIGVLLFLFGAYAMLQQLSEPIKIWSLLMVIVPLGSGIAILHWLSSRQSKENARAARAQAAIARRAPAVQAPSPVAAAKSMPTAQSDLVNAVLDVVGESGRDEGVEDTTGWSKVYLHAQLSDAQTVTYGAVFARRSGSLVRQPVAVNPAIANSLLALREAYAAAGHGFGWFDLTIEADTRYRFSFGDIASLPVAASEPAKARLARVSAATAAEMNLALADVDPPR